MNYMLVSASVRFVVSSCVRTATWDTRVHASASLLDLATMSSPSFVNPISITQYRRNHPSALPDIFEYRRPMTDSQ